MRPYSRRDFFARSLAAGAAWFSFPSLGSIASGNALRLGVVRRRGGPSAIEHGLALGAEEAVVSAGLFRLTVSVSIEEVAPGEAAKAAERLATTARVTLLVSALRDADECTAAARAANTRGITLLNASCAADVLRGAHCSPMLFHVAASDAMYRDAGPLATAHGETGKSDDHVVMWHHALEAYGASQLNDRFRSRFHEEMDGDAWAAWVAMKIAVESFLRARSDDPAAIWRFLSSANAQFDGHKGVPLSFRAWDHQLRQPLYAVTDDVGRGSRATLEELPGRSLGATAGASGTQARLDALGTSRNASACHMDNT